MRSESEAKWVESSIILILSIDIKSSVLQGTS